MINNRRRNFRSRQQKNNFRRRSSSNHGSNGHYSNSTENRNFNRNGSLSSPLSIEKVISKYQQLAKDAQSSGDPVLIENYLQHAEHYSRKLAEINYKNQSSANTTDKSNNVDINQVTSTDKEI